ncbi:RNA polymerase sigma factor, RpoD/SigA family [Acaryochloris marina]|uniref:RNA polymerase sigma factor, RpoD/SigA family n=1 Tax=Acaryochloris marina TaxID=155978 RepID=UPI001BB045FF|nr:RNA polymerase sigma factor, RpoD/SigA family [Acaryochloris marina]QUY45498.1 RNA polymerase sigma factor, RpoD/SigA family [Acaryochloris marina S15]
MTELIKRSKHNQSGVGKQKIVTDNVRLYLREIGRVPLLTHAQELQLSRQVQIMVSLQALKEQLTQSLGVAPSLQIWAEEAQCEISLLEEQLAQGQQAKQRMITANLRLVVVIAKKYQDRNLEFLDLIQEGTLGLARAVEKFDPQRGYRFSTYAYWWIRQGITRAIAEQGRTVRLPVHCFEKLNKIKRAQRQLSQSLGRSPTPAEIGKELSIGVEEVLESLRIAQHTLSLDHRVGDDQDQTVGDFIESEGPQPEQLVTQQLFYQSINQLLDSLPNQQRDVLILRYGLIDGQVHTLAAIGRRMGVSRERVRQIQQQAIKNLQKHKEGMQDFLAS